MGRNKPMQIRTHANRAIHAYRKTEYAEAVMCTKRVIEQVTTSLLRRNNVSPEEYQKKTNRHVEWSLEKKIRECEERDIIHGDLCAELYLVKDWRNDLEHANSGLAIKGFASQCVEITRKLYLMVQCELALAPIDHWPDNLQAGFGNMLPFSPNGVSMKDGQLVISGENGQRVCLDFVSDGASWIDEHGNKKYYKGTIAESNEGKGWIG